MFHKNIFFKCDKYIDSYQMPTKEELIEECKRLEIRGYSGKRKIELEEMCREVHRGENFSSPYHKLKNFMEDFGVEDKLHCVTNTASHFGISKNKVSKALLEVVNDQVDSCIGYSTNKPLFDYQKKVTNHLFTHHGLIAAFDTGTGKTLTAVSTAACIHSMGMLFNKTVKILVVTPASLKANMGQEFKKYPYNFGSSLEIISSNIFRDAMMYHTISRKGPEIGEEKTLKRLKKYSHIICDDNTFLIIDEAHEFKTDYNNIFEAGWIKDAKYPRSKMFVEECYPSVWKILLLTATPMLNKWYDIMNLIASVKNVSPMDLKKYIKYQNRSVILSKNQADVLGKDTVNVNDPVITNKREFKDVILFKNIAKISEVFPKRNNEKYVAVVMPKKYYEEVKKIKTIIGPKPKKRSLRTAWLEKRQKAIANLPNNPKIRIVQQQINSEKYDKIILYSRFVNPLEKLAFELERVVPKNWKLFLITGRHIPPHKRHEVLERINKTSKAIVLVTDAGSMGLDFKGLELVIIYEPGVNIAREEQVIGRAIRFKSHIHLPLHKRRVDIMRLILNNPIEVKIARNEEFTADQKLALNALRKYHETLYFREQLGRLQI